MAIIVCFSYIYKTLTYRTINQSTADMRTSQLSLLS